MEELIRMLYFRAFVQMALWAGTASQMYVDMLDDLYKNIELIATERERCERV